MCNVLRYTIKPMIRTFKDKPTAALFAGNVVRSLPVEIQQVALRKLKMIDVATSVMDLRVPRGNQLEALKGNRKGQYSIRINDQWRVCFRFTGGHAADVQIADYH